MSGPTPGYVEREQDSETDRDQIAEPLTDAAEFAPGSARGPAVDPALGSPLAPLPDMPRTLDLAAGERLTIAASAPGEVIVSVAEPTRSRGVAAERGPSVEIHHVAAEAGPVRVTAMAPLSEGGQTGRVMIARAPAEQAETSTRGDGARSLTRRHHLLLNLFGITPTDLHPQSTAALARQLDGLEVMARAVAEGEQQPALSDGALSIELTESDGYETARYTLERPDARLVLDTALDHYSGQLTCKLHFGSADGVSIEGRLTHAVARVDGHLSAPADPVGDYLARGPEANDADVDLSDLIDDGDEEGIVAFLTGALAGDFADNDSYSALAGQTAAGFVPVLGQIGDARDIAAAGSDVVEGAPGAWGRLGINLVAVIPGLDFLKAGRMASKEAIREGAETALDDTVRHSMKKLRRNGMSKAAARQAAKQIKVINAGRVELIERLRRYSAEGFFDDETLGVLMHTRNALENGLKPDDLSGALRDLHGIPVPLPGGKGTYDHLHEVQDSMNSLENALAHLKRSTKNHKPGSAGFSRVSRDRDAFEEFIGRVASFLETK